MKKHRKLKVFLIILPIVLVMLFAGFSWYVGDQVAKGAVDTQKREKTQGVTDEFFENFGMDKQSFYDSYTFEDMTIDSSRDGHRIPAQLIYSDSRDNDTVVLVHGLGGNMYKNYPVAEFFLSEGFNVLTYDQRGAGGNTAEYISFGALEKYDLTDCLDMLDTVAPGKRRGVWGCSQGGATAALAAAYEDTSDRLSFLILDCPLGNLKYMIETEMQDMATGIPVEYMSWCGNIMLKLNYGYNYDDADAEGQAKHITVPTLVINSRADEITPYFMGENIYERISIDNKQLWTVDDSPHADVWLGHNSEYKEKIRGFIAGL